MSAKRSKKVQGGNENFDDVFTHAKYDFEGSRFITLPEIKPILFQEERLNNYTIEIGPTFRDGYGVLNNTIHKYNSIINKPVIIKNFSSPLFLKHYRQTLLKDFIPHDNVTDNDFEYIETAYEIEHYIPDDYKNLKEFYYFQRFNPSNTEKYVINSNGFVECDGQIVMCQHELMMRQKKSLYEVIRVCSSSKYSRCKYCGASFEDLLSEDFIFNEEMTEIIKMFISYCELVTMRLWKLLVDALETIDKDFSTKSDVYILGLLSTILYKLLITGLQRNNFTIAERKSLKLTKKFDTYFLLNGWNEHDVNILMKKINAEEIIDEIIQEKKVIDQPTSELTHIKKFFNESETNLEKNDLVRFNEVDLKDVKMNVNKSFETLEKSAIEDFKQVVCTNIYHDFNSKDICKHCGLKRDYSNSSEIKTDSETIEEKLIQMATNVIQFERLPKEEIELAPFDEAEHIYSYITGESIEFNYNNFNTVKHIFLDYLIKMDEKYDLNTDKKFDIENVKKVFSESSEIPYQLYKQILSIMFSKNIYLDQFITDISLTEVS